jgi:hypothetical protein
MYACLGKIKFLDFFQIFGNFCFKRLRFLSKMINFRRFTESDQSSIFEKFLILSKQRSSFMGVKFVTKHSIARRKPCQIRVCLSGKDFVPHYFLDFAYSDLILP